MVASALLALVIVVVVLIIVTGGKGKPAAVALPPVRHPVGPESILNPSNLLAQDPAGVLDVLKRLGVTRVQDYVIWSSMVPDPGATVRPDFDAADPAAYPATSWTSLDTIVRDAAARGIKVDLAFTPPPPLWASGKGAPTPAATHPYWRPNASDFESFVGAVGTRYSGHYIPPGQSTPLPRVSFWAIWNEPNLGIMLAPQTSHHSKVEESGSIYRQLVNAAWSALHATGHGHDTILIGELAPAGATFGNAPGLFAAMAPLRFLRALYCVDSSYRPLRGQAAALRHCPTDAQGSARFAAENPGLFHASAFSDHPYPQGLPPNKATPDEPDFAELADIPKLERVLDTLQRVYGSSTKFPIYSTEFGYQTTPPDKEAGTVSPQTAAMYLNWSEYLTWRDPRIRSYDQYLLNDPASGSFASGLRTYAGLPKPGWYAFRMPIFLPVTNTAKDHPLEVWGCVRPVYYTRRHSDVGPVLIQFRPSSGGRFHTVRSLAVTDRYGYFDVLQTFPSSGSVRLAWAYPHGPQIFSRTVTVVLH